MPEFQEIARSRDAFLLACAISAAAVFSILDCSSTQYLMSLGYPEANPIFLNDIRLVWLFKGIGVLSIIGIAEFSNRTFRIGKWIAPAGFSIATAIPVLNNFMYVFGVWT